LYEAKVLVERWRWEYNTIRPHGSLGYKPPAPEAECLNQHYFVSLNEAREVVEMWREDYNEVRPHQSLSNQTPLEFKEQLLNKNRFITACHTPVCLQF